MNSLLDSARPKTTDDGIEYHFRTRMFVGRHVLVFVPVPDRNGLSISQFLQVMLETALMPLAPAAAVGLIALKMAERAREQKEQLRADIEEVLRENGVGAEQVIIVPANDKYPVILEKQKFNYVLMMRKQYRIRYAGPLLSFGKETDDAIYWIAVDKPAEHIKLLREAGFLAELH